MFKGLAVSLNVNVAKLKWDLEKPGERYEAFWKEQHKDLIPQELFRQNKDVWLEVGAGSGWFFVEMARLHPEKFLIAIERSRLRGQRLVRKAQKSMLPNLAPFRGNAIPTVIHGVPGESVNRLYLLYPCPWPKNAQRRNRWYLHPIMPHFLRILKPGAQIVWASDQKFYIDEAKFVCEQKYGMKVLAYGELAPNPYNDLALFPGGRTKFENMFLNANQSCYELIVEKS